MKKEYPLKKIMDIAGRPCDYTNRSFFFKSINNVLNTGLVEIEVTSIGKVWVSRIDNKTEYNLRIKAAGFVRKSNIKGEMEPSDILRQIGNLLLDERVKEKIKSFVHLRSSECSKCSGRGIIPHFHYYCSGICFDCGGSGYNMNHYDKTSVEIIS